MADRMTPTTDAGRQLLDLLESDSSRPFLREVMAVNIMDVEEAARTEGRQQAVRLLEDAENLIRSYVPQGSRLREQWLSEVAGLNASESPPHEGGPLCIDCDKPFQHLGDASESGRRGDNVVTGSAALTSNAGDTAGWADVRDASKSGQPPDPAGANNGPTWHNEPKDGWRP